MATAILGFCSTTSTHSMHPPYWWGRWKLWEWIFFQNSTLFEFGFLLREKQTNPQWTRGPYRVYKRVCRPNAHFFGMMRSRHSSRRCLQAQVRLSGGLNSEPFVACCQDHLGVPLVGSRFKQMCTGPQSKCKFGGTIWGSLTKLEVAASAAPGDKKTRTVTRGFP